MFLSRSSRFQNMADIELRGSLSRIRKCAYELLSIEDLMDDEDSWDLIASDLRLKSTFLFCDFKQLISHSSEEKKFSLTEIANRLFYYIQELDHALQICNVPLMQHRYNDTALVLHEVLAAIMPE